MKVTEEEPWGNGAGPSERPNLRASTIDSLYELHAEVEAATDALRTFSGPAARRRVRDAKAAEADLMRVLGFASWEEFIRFAGPPQQADIDLVAEEAAEAAAASGAGDTRPVEPLLAEVRAARAELASLRVDIGSLRADVGSLRDALRDAGEDTERVLLEVVALRLEFLVQQRRQGAS